MSKWTTIDLNDTISDELEIITKGDTRSDNDAKQYIGSGKQRTGAKAEEREDGRDDADEDESDIGADEYDEELEGEEHDSEGDEDSSEQDGAERLSSKSGKQQQDEGDRLGELAKSLQEAEARRAREMADLRRDLAARDETSKKASALSVRRSEIEAAKLKNATEVQKARNAFVQAREDGDAKAELAATERLNRLNLEALAHDSDLDVLAAEAEKLANAKPTQRKAEDHATEDNAFAVEWVNRNSWVQNDERAAQLVLHLSNGLILAGGDPTKQGFYDKLDKVVKDFVIDNGLAYKVVSRNGSKSPTEKKDEAKAVDRKRSNQVSRQAASETLQIERTKDGKIRVKPTKEDREWADRMGLPIEDYMKERVKYERSHKGHDRENGPAWTTIT